MPPTNEKEQYLNEFQGLNGGNQMTLEQREEFNRRVKEMEDAIEQEKQEISQADVDALTQSESEETPTTKDTKMSFGGIAAALKQAVANGNLTPQQAAGMRRDMGISQSYFTGKKVNPNKRKRKNKAAKQARKVTQRNGFKGQKMTKGKR